VRVVQTLQTQQMTAFIHQRNDHVPVIGAGLGLGGRHDVLHRFVCEHLAFGELGLGQQRQT
jgi:hypothetical protein